MNRGGQVVALAGELKRLADGVEPRWWHALAGWLIQRPTEDFAEAQPENLLGSGRDIAAALQGTPATRTRRTLDGRAVVVSAAHPIWSGDEVVGAVVAEETTNPIVSMKSEAMERLLLLTLAAFAGAALLLIAFATRLSMRIRRLRDEAESAIDARGRLTRLAAGSEASDEIGDLSRSFSAVLERLAQHHAYLESMAGRLSHELRTPMAVVRSSLENLKLAPSDGDARRYIDRAEATTCARWCAAASKAIAPPIRVPRSSSSCRPGAWRSRAPPISRRSSSTSSPRTRWIFRAPVRRYA